MKRLSFISIFAAVSILGFVFCQDISAQVPAEGASIMMTGEFTDRQATGIYIKGNDETLNLNWSVFLDNDGKVFKITVVDHQVTELFVDGQKIPNENISQYAAATKQFLDRLKMTEEIENQEKDIDAKEEDIDEQENEIDKISDRIDKAQDKLDSLEENRPVDLSLEKDNLSKLRDKTSKLRDTLSAKRDLLSSERDKLYEKREKYDNIDELDKVLDKIISDLKAEGIVKNSNNVSFKLSNKEFIVNGKGQSADFHQRMKSKYIADSPSETGFLYRWKEKI